MTSIVAYHGTNQVFEEFKSSYGRVTNDYYGGGVAYCTDEINVARQYARSAAKRGGKEVIYRVRLNLGKTFDVNHEYKGNALLRLIGSDIEGFARSAGLLPYGVDKFKVINDIRSGETPLKGDVIFKGLSRGMVNTVKAREALKHNGFTSLRYNPVQHSQRLRHSVWIMYNERDIDIEGLV